MTHEEMLADMAVLWEQYYDMHPEEPRKVKEALAYDRTLSFEFLTNERTALINHLKDAK